MKLIVDYRFEFLWMLTRDLSLMLESMPSDATVTLRGSSVDSAPKVDDIWLAWSFEDEVRQVRLVPQWETKHLTNRVLTVGVFCYASRKNHGDRIVHKASHQTLCQEFEAFARFTKSLAEQIFAYVLTDRILPLED